ncbi:MAG: hypothetical protein HPY79_07185 [Bacteroidales bacterium]|nr:hypothetical protein [Bacteroidales bacterium]
MKKKNTILYLIFVIVLTLAIIVFINNNKSTLKKELRDFAYEDTASVNKIFLADKNNHAVLLERINAHTWRVNNKFNARADAIKNLLDAIASVQVKSPVPKSAFETATKHLATRSIKVEIYANNKKVKTYYVGPATPDNLGTYMILENSSVPFITHKPGFNGYLTVRYFVDEQEWRDVSLFSIPINSFYSLQVRYPEHPLSSYTIIRKSARDYQLLNYQNTNMPIFDTLLAKETVLGILKAKVDIWTYDMPQSRIDSLNKATALAHIKIKTIKGETYSLDLHRMPNIKKYIDNSGNVMPYDPDIMYGIYNGNTPALCQYFTFDPILLSINDFTSQTKK